ncbi:MAG: ubiquinone/menaquinone biosynthesis methyltransferase [Anaerolineaceae bacterium]|nr:ubiquinone/menaquinone biosynthesis methyltransferase [Anaerolineaceae bacterium]
MNHPTPGSRENYVRDVFTRIAPRYDLMNRLMTAGQDVRWRQEVVRRAQISPGTRLLDLGAGTGDLAREALRQQPLCQAVAADFTLEMMRVGMSNASTPVQWTGVDALHLPFPGDCFDEVVSGFLLRNVADLQAGLQEQYRVLKPGGRFVALDTTRPRRNWFTPLVRVHLHTVIPWLGWLLTGQRDAYTYLPDSTENFIRAEELVARLAAVGFRDVGYQVRMFGSIAIHWARKG